MAKLLWAIGMKNVLRYEINNEERNPSVENSSTRSVKSLFTVSLLGFLLTAAFLPISSVTYVIQAMVVIVILAFVAMGCIRGVSFRKKHFWVLALVYGYAFIRVVIEILLEGQISFFFNLSLWIVLSSSICLFLLSPDYSLAKYKKIKSYVVILVCGETLIGFVQYKTSGLVGGGAGDVVVGTLKTANSHLFGMMILTLGFALLLSTENAPGWRGYKIKFKWDHVAVTMAVLAFLLSSFLLGLVFVLVFSAATAIFLLKGKKRTYAILAGAVLTLVFSYTQRENAGLLYDYVSMAGDQFPYAFPRKLLALIKTSELYKGNPLLLLFGTGAGLYNSRAAMVLTNHYLDKDIGFVSMSFYTQNIIAPLWDRSALGFTDSVVNQPWFSIFQIISEFGLIVFLAILAYIGFILKKLKDLPTTLFVAYLIGSLLLDNLLEFPQFMFVAYVSLWLVYYRPHARAGRATV